MDFMIGLIGLYLSPDNYLYGQDAENFFNNVTSLWQELNDCDILVGGGDLNCRTKDMNDFIAEIDGDLPCRTNPDQVKNAHGVSFLSFLKENRALILNGRITPEFNNFTFVSPQRGSSVPDYLFCPIDNLKYCAEVKIMIMTDIVNLSGILPPLHLPDHSVIQSILKYPTSE